MIVHELYASWKNPRERASLGGPMPQPPDPYIDRELAELLDMGDRILRLAQQRGGSDLVAECVLRSGAELSARVRKGEAELVEEAGTRSAGLRVIPG